MKIFSVKILTTIFLFIWLISCATSTSNNNSFISSIELKSKIQIAKGYARVFLQSGKDQVGVGRYEHSCEIEVNDISDGMQFILPDKFTITGISHRRTSNELTGLAAPLFGCRDTIFYETYFNLFSDKQAKVRQMVCREGFNSCFGHFANKQQIQKTLGNNFVVE